MGLLKPDMTVESKYEHRARKTTQWLGALTALPKGSEFKDNLTRACSLVREAAKQGANIVSLPVSIRAACPFFRSCGSTTVLRAGSGPLMSHLQQCLLEP